MRTKKELLHFGVRWGLLCIKKCKILIYFLSTWSQDVFLYLDMIGEKIPEINYNSNWVGGGGGLFFLLVFFFNNFQVLILGAGGCLELENL